jgi:hypothetical protein
MLQEFKKKQVLGKAVRKAQDGKGGPTQAQWEASGKSGVAPFAGVNTPAEKKAKWVGNTGSRWPKLAPQTGKPAFTAPTTKPARPTMPVQRAKPMIAPAKPERYSFKNNDGTTHSGYVGDNYMDKTAPAKPAVRAIKPNPIRIKAK